MKTTTFRVGRDDIRTTGFVDGDIDIADGEVLLAVDTFALTANNITYAVFGDVMNYWGFFPAADGWGHIPVWGFADVASSRCEGITAGERIYGYYPMGTHTKVAPGRVTETSFLDGAEHRRSLPAAYQHYLRCEHDALYAREREDQHAIFYPLFFTSFMAEDLLSDNGLFGADQVVIASASSKTALGIAFLLKRKGARPIALTSEANAAFCERTGYYDAVFTYDAVGDLDRTPTVFVDVSGNGRVMRAVHEHLRDAMTYSLVIGATHWEDRSVEHDLPGPQPQTFFAPTQGAKRRRDWGPEALEAKVLEAWQAFIPTKDAWLEVRHGTRDDVERVYREVLEGRQPPHVGHMLTLAR